MDSVGYRLLRNLSRQTLLDDRHMLVRDPSIVLHG